METIVLKPDSFGKVFNKTWIYTKENFNEMAKLALYASLPNIILILIAGIIGNHDGSVPLFLGGLFRLVGALAIFVIMFHFSFDFKAKLEGKKSEFNIFSNYKYSVRILSKSFVTCLILGIFIIGLFFLFVVPAIIFSVFWTFVVPVIVFKEKYGMDALKYSKSVVKGRWWRAWYYGFVIGGVVFIALLIPVLIFTLGFNMMIIGACITGFVSIFMSLFALLFKYNMFFTFDATKQVKAESAQSEALETPVATV